jgi:hypothetical protein
MALKALFVLQDRLLHWPQHKRSVLSVFLPSGSTQWLAVESTSMTDVQHLCLNVTSIHHPLDVSLIPVDQWVSYLQWGPTPPCLMATSWARVRRAYVMRELDIPTNLCKYAGALAFVLAKPKEAVADICIVPKLYVKIEREGKKAQRKQLPRLLHPNTIGLQQKDWGIPHPMDPDVWWHWGLHHRLEMVSEGVYKFKRPKGDLYMPPFAIFTVPVTALHVTGVVPKHNELNLFHEGMAIGAVHLQFPAPSPEFIRWSYECYVAVLIEIGNNVEANINPGLVRGVIADIQFENVVVQLKDLQIDDIEVHIQHVRRYYQLGDAVKVIRSRNAVKAGKSQELDREGLVVVINEDDIEVLDCRCKEQV